MMEIPPMPESRAESASSPVPLDFVNEAAVARLLSEGGLCAAGVATGGADQRCSPDDFAGWPAARAKPCQHAPIEQFRRRNQRRMPERPAGIEPGIGDPHRGPHRWWLASLAGALSTLLFASLFYFLSLTSEISVDTAATGNDPVFLRTTVSSEPEAADEEPGRDIRLLNVSSTH